jgi:hypothetical protein
MTISTLELNQDLFRDGLESVEDALTRERDRLKRLYSTRIEDLFHVIQIDRGREVALVVLDHEGELFKIFTVLPKVILEALEALDVRIETLDLGIRDEHDPIDPLQDQLTARVIEDLSRDSKEMEASLKPTNLTQRDGEEVKEESPLGPCL